MISKNEIKDIQSLTQKKVREDLKLFVAEGPKIVAELITIVPGSFVKIYATKEWIQSVTNVVNDVTEISQKELERISHLQTPNQVVAIIRQPDHWEPKTDTLVLFLDTIQDPGNFGTIIRIADWFHVLNVVCSSGCADIYNPKVVQSTMGSIARVNVYYDEEGTWLPKQKVPVYAATLDGKSLFNHARTDKGILVIGNESKGIRPEIMEYATEKITIPKKGGAESLNAAVATGIILSHLLS
jgi:TrmH family RNA methyltransferase